MDAACAASALVGLIFNCATAVKTCNDLLGKYRNAPQTLRSIETEVSTLEASLLQLQHLMLRDRAALASRWDIQSLLPQTFETAIESFKRLFSVLLADLDKLNDKRRDSADLRITWGWKIPLLWKEGSMQDMLSRIRAHQQSLQFLMTILQMGSISDIKRGIRENQELLRSLERASLKHGQEYRDSQQEEDDSEVGLNDEPPAKRRSLSPEKDNEDDQLEPIPNSAHTREAKVFYPSIEGRVPEEGPSTTRRRRRKSKSSTPHRESRGSTPLRDTPDPNDKLLQNEGYFNLGRVIHPSSSDWSSSFRYNKPITSIETDIDVRTKTSAEKRQHSHRRHRSHTSSYTHRSRHNDPEGQDGSSRRYPTPESESFNTSFRRQSSSTPSSNYSPTEKSTSEDSSSMRKPRRSSGLYSPLSTISDSAPLQSYVAGQEVSLPRTSRMSYSPCQNKGTGSMSHHTQRSIDNTNTRSRRSPYHVRHTSNGKEPENTPREDLSPTNGAPGARIVENTGKSPEINKNRNETVKQIPEEEHLEKFPPCSQQSSSSLDTQYNTDPAINRDRTATTLESKPANQTENHADVSNEISPTSRDEDISSFHSHKGHAADFPFSDDESPISALFDARCRNPIVRLEVDMDKHSTKGIGHDPTSDIDLQQTFESNTSTRNHQRPKTSTNPQINPSQSSPQSWPEPQASTQNFNASPPSRNPTATPKKQHTMLQATEADARKHRIPQGYSLKNWDPTKEPILLLGSVFDANSLGKWIYDWTVYHHGPSTPIADTAGELWLLIIQLAGKIKRAEECISRIRSDENREMVDDFIESGERLTDKFKKLLKSCETPMLKAGKKQAMGQQLDKNAGTEFVDSIFGEERMLRETEKFMGNMRLWNFRFDANCEDILREPGR